GRFVGEASWPSPRIVLQTLHMTAAGLRPDGAGTADLVLQSPAWTGLAVGEWMGTGVTGEEPTDQRHDDAFSLVFDSEPLSDRLELLGAPEIAVELASDKPVA